MTLAPNTFDGACTCRDALYRMMSRPMFVHRCHCRWCQRETGTAFALNAMIESERVALLAGEVDLVDTSSWQRASIPRSPRPRLPSVKR